VCEEGGSVSTLLLKYYPLQANSIACLEYYKQQMEYDNSTRQEDAILSHKGSFFRFLASEYNRACAYPVGPRPDPALYHPAAAWIGRLILPKAEERRSVVGALMEVQYAEPAYAHLIGRIVRLRWDNVPETNQRFWSTTRSVEFSRKAKQLVDE